MKLRPWLLPVLLLLVGFSTQAQRSFDPSTFLPVRVNQSVMNQDEEYFTEIVDLWDAYLTTFNNEAAEALWSKTTYPAPDYVYRQLKFDLYHLYRTQERDLQGTILGLLPLEDGYYHLNALYSSTDSTGAMDINYIVSVYATRESGEFKLVSSNEYHRSQWRTEQVGQVTYYIHPDHEFDASAAEKMNAFNREIAAKFEAEPINIDYFVANTTDDISKLIGFDYYSYSFQPTQSGGMADISNQIIYAGNNSAYYPHEVVHLYTSQRFRGQYYQWVDEGIAAFFGGSTGYYLEWHLHKLKRFLEENPDFSLQDIDSLSDDIPNGEYKTRFMYAVGGFIIQKIHEKEGMAGLFDALQAGSTLEDYYRLIEEKLGVKHEDYTQYIRRELAKMPDISDEELDKLKY